MRGTTAAATMTLSFVCNNEPLQLIPGLPENYPNKLRGADAYHCATTFGIVALQEVITPMVLFRILHIFYEEPAVVVCHHTHEHPVLYVRTTPEQPAYECIKGVGIRHFEQKQYSWVSGKSWYSVLRPHESGHYRFIDTVWQTDFVKSTCRNHVETLFRIGSSRERIPEIIEGPRHYLSPGMQQILIGLKTADYSATAGSGYLHDRMEAYLKLLVADDKTYTWKRLGIRQADWEAVHRAISVITDHPEIHYTIPELSRKAAINEFKLKMLFPRITGYTIDDYRKNLLLRKTRDLLADTPDSIKTIYPHSGYSSFSSFSAGFRKIFYCSPGEIRQDVWDTGNF